MSQVKSGTCLYEFAPIPDLQAQFHGKVGEDPSGFALLNKWCEEKPRRTDTPRRGSRESYGGITKKTPTLNTAAVDWAGVATPNSKVAYDSVATLYGNIQVPRERDTQQFTPSVDTLHFLSHSQGTRLAPYPLRYFP